MTCYLYVLGIACVSVGFFWWIHNWYLPIQFTQENEDCTCSINILPHVTVCVVNNTKLLITYIWWRKSIEWTCTHFLFLNCLNFGASWICSQGNTLFTCYVCDRTFLSSEELTQHQPTHSKDDKPFKCVHCKESFKTFSEVSKTITANINTC